MPFLLSSSIQRTPDLFTKNPYINSPPSLTHYKATKQAKRSCYQQKSSPWTLSRDPLLSTIQHLMDIPADEMEKAAVNAPTRAYVRDRKAMASTPADVKELPGALVFEIDMPGVKPGEIKVQVEDENVLVVSGERKRAEDKDAKYVLMERRVGKFMRRFVLPENANVEGISAVCRDGVLTVTVPKKLPPEPKKIEVRVG